MSSGLTLIPNHVVDVWMLHLTEAQFRLVMAMLRHGWSGRCTLPRHERHRLPSLLDLRADTAYRTLKTLVRLGAVHENGTGYAVNLDFVPPEARTL